MPKSKCKLSFNCTNCTNWKFPFTDLTDNEFCEEILIKKDIMELNANYLNVLFGKNETAYENEKEKYDLTYLDDVIEQYVDLTSTDFMKFETSSCTFSAICINIRSLVNSTRQTSF